jgi:hypothetical protein
MKYSRRIVVRLFASVQVVASLRFLDVVFQHTSLSRSGTDFAIVLCWWGNTSEIYLQGPKKTNKFQRIQKPKDYRIAVEALSTHGTIGDNLQVVSSIMNGLYVNFRLHNLVSWLCIL